MFGGFQPPRTESQKRNDVSSGKYYHGVYRKVVIRVYENTQSNRKTAYSPLGVWFSYLAVGFFHCSEYVYLDSIVTQSVMGDNFK